MQWLSTGYIGWMSSLLQFLPPTIVLVGVIRSTNLFTSRISLWNEFLIFSNYVGVFSKLVCLDDPVSLRFPPKFYGLSSWSRTLMWAIRGLVDASLGWFMPLIVVSPRPVAWSCWLKGYICTWNCWDRRSSWVLKEASRLFIAAKEA